MAKKESFRAGLTTWTSIHDRSDEIVLCIVVIIGRFSFVFLGSFSEVVENS